MSGQGGGEAIERVVLVTGAASGIGAAVARRIAAPGIGLVIHTRSREEVLAKVTEEVEAAGALAVRVTGDLAEPATAERLVEAARTRFGRLDALVANAGYAQRGGLETTTPGDLEKAWRTMAGGLFALASGAVPLLRASPMPRIVAVSSFGARRYRGDALFLPTSAAKAGLESLVKSLAAELAPAGIAVNAVAPGYVEKDGGHSSLSPDAWARVAAEIPMGRLGRREEVAGLIAFLLGPEAGYMTGQVIRADGGLTLG